MDYEGHEDGELTLTVYMKYALVGLYRQQQNGIGKGALSLRTRAPSARLSAEVLATNWMMRSLGGLVGNGYEERRGA